MPRLPRGSSALAALALTMLLSGPTHAVERSDCLTLALEYVNHEWVCEEINMTGVDCPEGYLSDFCLEPGEYVGLPYDWGGSFTLEGFDEGIAEGKAAGSHSSDGVLECSVGVDCSGFVSQLWGCGHYSTSTLHYVSTEIDARDMWGMDAYNDAGSHVIAWQDKDEYGAALIVESSGTCNGTCQRSVDWSYFSTYVPIRAHLDYVQTATIGSYLGTTDDPIPIDTFPATDWRNTREATSDVFDYYSAAPETDETGPEFIYELNFPSPGDFTASIHDAPQTDLDLHLLGSLDADDCIARDHLALDVSIDTPGIYYLVVDTYIDYAGAYHVEIDFSPSDVDTDTDSDSDTDTDTDTDSDIDTDSDSDADTDTGSDNGAAAGTGVGCGCAAAGIPGPRGLLPIMEALL